MPRPIALRHAAALLLLAALWGVFFWRILTPDPSQRVTFADVDFVQHYYAFASYQTERLRDGEFPLWNPYNHAGDPFAGNVQFAAFYPPRLLAVLLAGMDGTSIAEYQLEAALHILLASFLMYGYLCVYCGRWRLALFGSVLYAYAGYLPSYPLFQAGVLFSAVWLPLILTGVHLSVHRAGWRDAGAALAAVGIALSLLGGHPQTTMYLTYTAVCYLLWRGWLARLPLAGIVWRLGLMGAAAAGLGAVQLLPALELARLSSRVDLTILEKGSGFRPVEWLHLLVPGVWTSISPLFVGAAGLMLALMGALHGTHQRRLWIVLFAVGMALSLGLNGFLYPLFYQFVPGFNMFRQQERIAVVIVFALVMLAVEGLAWWWSAPPVLRRRWLGAFVLYAAGLGAAAIAATDAAPFVFAGGMSLLSAAALMLIQWPRAGFATLLAVIVLNLFPVAQRQAGYQPDTPAHRVSLPPLLAALPTAPDEVRWRMDGAAGLGGYGTLFRIADIYGTGPFTLASIDALRRIPVDRFWEVLAVRFVTTADIMPPGVAAALRGTGTSPHGTPFRLYELSDPRPLAHLVYDTRDAGGSPAFARQIMADSRVNLREMAITLHPLPVTLSPPQVSGRVAAFEMAAPERWQMRVTTPAPALLTLALPFYPGWVATVDAVRVELHDVNGGLSGLLLPAGDEMEIVVEYQPESVRLGLLILATSALGLAVIAAAGRRHRGRAQSAVPPAQDSGAGGTDP